MKEANLIIIKNRHNGDNVIENVLNYVLSSIFADTDEIMVNGISDNNYYQMVQDFYSVQEPYAALKNHRRVFHMILTSRVSKDMQQNLDEGAKAFLEFMKIHGYQVLMVPHYGSATN